MNIEELLHDFIDFCLSIKNRKYKQDQVKSNNISLLINNIEKEAIRQGANTDDIKQIQYVMIALIDELVCENYPELKAQWSADSLQVKSYHHHIAGELFFVKLEAALQNNTNNINLLKVFLICLLLGFKGRYQQQPQKLKEYQHAILSVIEKHHLKSSSPRRQNTIKLYQLIIIALSVALFFYIASMLWVDLSSHAFVRHLNEIKEAYDVSSHQHSAFT